MKFIKNQDALLSHGNTALRRDALDILDSSLTASDPYQSTISLVSRSENGIHVGAEFLPVTGKVYVVGAGKASYYPVKALEEVLGDLIADGVLVCKYGQEGTTSRVRMLHAAHPLPDKTGCRAPG